MKITKKRSLKSQGKKQSKTSTGSSKPLDFLDMQLLSQPILRKRESKRSQKNEQENNARLLEIYNDLKTNQETKELPTKQVYLRRIGLNLVKHREDLYKFPILQYVEETSKIMLLNEFELLYWYHLMKTYLKHLRQGAYFSHESVRLFFF